MLLNSQSHIFFQCSFCSREANRILSRTKPFQWLFFFIDACLYALLNNNERCSMQCLRETVYIWSNDLTTGWALIQLTQPHVQNRTPSLDHFLLTLSTDIQTYIHTRPHAYKLLSWGGFNGWQFLGRVPVFFYHFHSCMYVCDTLYGDWLHIIVGNFLLLYACAGNVLYGSLNTWSLCGRSSTASSNNRLCTYV